MNQNTEQKALQGLSELLKNEDRYLLSNSRTFKTCLLLGVAILVVSFIICLKSGNDFYLIFFLLGFVGTALASVAVQCLRFERQWKVIRKFINEQEIHEEANKNNV